MRLYPKFTQRTTSEFILAQCVFTAVGATCATKHGTAAPLPSCQWGRGVSAITLFNYEGMTTTYCRQTLHPQMRTLRTVNLWNIYLEEAMCKRGDNLRDTLTPVSRFSGFIALCIRVWSQNFDRPHNAPPPIVWWLHA